jgi:transposase
VPVVPYAWQEKGATLELPSFRGKYINVAGFYQITHQRKMYFFEQETISAAKLVEIFYNFAKNITQKTVVVLDNAPIHKSKLFQSKIEQWERENDLFVFFIPTYSPELNLIEIFWRMINGATVRYKWLSFSAYNSFENLKKELQKINENQNEKYNINFV